MRRATPQEAADLLDAARAAVTVRYREAHAFNFANPVDVLVAGVGRGVDVVWFGALPAHRLPLRAHYGYLLLKNGVLSAAGAGPGPAPSDLAKWPPAERRALAAIVRAKGGQPEADYLRRRRSHRRLRARLLELGGRVTATLSAGQGGGREA